MFEKQHTGKYIPYKCVKKNLFLTFREQKKKKCCFVFSGETKNLKDVNGDCKEQCACTSTMCTCLCDDCELNTKCICNSIECNSDGECVQILSNRN
jgi:hypothetical protein